MLHSLVSVWVDREVFIVAITGFLFFKSWLRSEYDGRNQCDSQSTWVECPLSTHPWTGLVQAPKLHHPHE